MGGLIARAGKTHGLQIVQGHIHTGHAHKISLCIMNGGDNADHHDLFTHELIYIGLHQIGLAG